MRLPLAILSLALLAGCASLSGYTADQARGDLVAVQKIHADVLKTETAYVNQPPCGLDGSPPPPFCASYKVALQMQAANRDADFAIAGATGVVNSAASTATALKAAVDQARQAVASWQSIVNAAAPQQ